MRMEYTIIQFHVTDVESLAKAICDITKAELKYMERFDIYQIDYFMVDTVGRLIFDDRADSEEIENLLGELYKKGFK